MASAMRRARALGLLASLGGLAGAAAAATVAGLADLTLEQLGSIEVTSVSRRAEPLADAPASIFVITNEDIRRSGAKSYASSHFRCGR